MDRELMINEDKGPKELSLAAALVGKSNFDEDVEGCLEQSRSTNEVRIGGVRMPLAKYRYADL